MKVERDDAWRQIKVMFRKAVSDGNYGTESAEVMLEEWMSTDVSEMDYALRAGELLEEAEAAVHAQLLRSPSQRVRSAITAETVHGEDD